MRIRDLAVATLVGVSCVMPGTAPAQSRWVVRAPQQAWRTVETEHWSVHYPARAEAFAGCLVPRLEPLFRATSAIVGFTPAVRVTLVIEDAMSFDGAFASANARAPVIVLQTQPSIPRTGGYSDCATARMVHELVHILQLARPWSAAHSPWTRAFMRTLPAEPGPIIFKRKAWLRESYAEHVEGLLTPTGAPYTTWRANVVRMLALGDRLPAYGALSDSHDGQYFVGAAFVDWIAARSGEAAFRVLWERMASPNWAGEDAAFRDLFGAPGDSLYAEFVVDAKEKAEAVRARFSAAGLVRGTMVRRLGYAEVVATSPDGTRVAAVVGSPTLRLTVWSTRDTSAPPLILPLPTGQSPRAPRFTHDGRVLLVNWEMQPNGLWRPDLFEWTFATRSMRRVTRGAAIREADPFPDGRDAVGTRCEFGVCDLVRIALATGHVRTLAAGAPDRTYSNPRVSADGGTVTAAVQTGATSRIVLLDAVTGASRFADPEDGIWRYEPAFLRDGRLVVVSEASGIPNLEIIDVATGSTRPLTRMIASALAPEPDPIADAVYFIRSAPGGSELWRIPIDSGASSAVSVRDSAFGPSAPVPLPRPAPALFRPDSVPRPRGYGAGPRFGTVLPGFAWNGDGASASAIVWTSDIVGRASVMADATIGNRAAWRGAGASAAIRAFPIPVFVRAGFTRAGNTRYHGVSARGVWERGSWAHRQRLSLGAVVGEGSADTGRMARRVLGTIGLGGSHYQVGDWYANESLSLSATAGRSHARGWTRGIIAAALEVGRTNVASLLTLSAKAGISSAGTPDLERFSIGGAPSFHADDIAVEQHFAQAMFGVGALRLARVATVRVEGPRIGSVSPFVWWGSHANNRSGAETVLGVSRALADDPRRNWRVPGARLAGGAGYGLGAVPGFRGYLSLTFVQ